VAGASPRFLTSIITLNLIAPLLVAQQANDVMQGQDGGGSIINIASVNGLRAAPLTAAYGAAKAGLLNLTESLAVEWGPRVRVNAVTAGIIGSEEMFALHYDGDNEFVASLTRQIPMGRMTTGADVGGVCLFLASPLAQQISGANILVHGGAEPAGSTGAG
jgi:NAD(P)-dependent dehydrogenase (short-subunit alcohol dehydrogenase family)